uniref:Uncharacterized protein n=1 Tax=Rhizophora mucronata TaxID=61149 RepID=A0A2P2MM35_RHIMU
MKPTSIASFTKRTKEENENKGLKIRDISFQTHWSTSRQLESLHSLITPGSRRN